MTITDIATFMLSIFFMMRGASRGFVKSLIAPFSIIIATVISIIYYQITKNIIVSSIIGLIGPILLSLLFKFLLKAWTQATNTDIKPNFLSRLGGSILTLVWGWVFILFALILLIALPPWGEKSTAIHNDVAKSMSYALAKPLVGIAFSSNQNVSAVAAVTSVASSNDAKMLSEDPRFQKVMQDPDIQKEVDAHDMVKLMSNPKMMALVQQIMNDPATMKKVLAIYKSQSQAQIKTNP